MFPPRARRTPSRTAVILVMLVASASASATGCFGRVRDECLDVANEGASDESACRPSDSTEKPITVLPPATEGASAAVHTTESTGAEACVIFAVAPLQVNVGGEISVTVFPSSRVTAFLWTASGGEFDDATAPAARFSCEAPGEHTLTLTVSGCPQKYTAKVRCI